MVITSRAHICFLKLLGEGANGGDVKYLPSKIDYPSKRDSAETAKNICIFVRCEERNKPWLVFSKHKLKERESNFLKRVCQNEILYTCDSTFSEYDSEIYKPVCIIGCGCTDDFLIEVENYTQCTRCTNLGCSKVTKRKRKRKQVMISHLNKKQQKYSGRYQI